MRARGNKNSKSAVNAYGNSVYSGMDYTFPVLLLFMKSESYMKSQI
jgi:hypothetical protein